MLEADQAERLSDALFAASRYWDVELQPSKGLAGAEALAAARDTATNPALLDAFALAIVNGLGPPAYPEIAGHAPDLPRACRDANMIARATAELRKLVPNPGSYVSESDFFEKRLAARILGRELSAPASGQGEIRSGWPILCAPRRWQRGVERRWF